MEEGESDEEEVDPPETNLPQAAQAILEHAFQPLENNLTQPEESAAGAPAEVVESTVLTGLPSTEEQLVSRAAALCHLCPAKDGKERTIVRNLSAISSTEDGLVGQVRKMNYVFAQ